MLTNLDRSTAVDDIEFVRWLVANGADINARSQLDESVLSIAIASGSIAVVDFLLTQETDYTRGDLLHCAAQRANQRERRGVGGTSGSKRSKCERTSL